MSVLIAYGSRYGSTEEIATKLAGYLGDKGIEATILNLKKEKKWPNLEGYDGVIVGSSVKITKWMNEPIEFLRKNNYSAKQVYESLGMKKTLYEIYEKALSPCTNSSTA